MTAQAFTTYEQVIQYVSSTASQRDAYDTVVVFLKKNQRKLTFQQEYQLRALLPGFLADQLLNGKPAAGGQKKLKFKVSF